MNLFTVCVHIRACMWRLEDNLKSVFSFCLMGSGDQTAVLRPGGKHPLGLAILQPQRVDLKNWILLPLRSSRVYEYFNSLNLEENFL